MEYIISLSAQTKGFLFSLGLGAVIGVIYDLIRVVRLTFTRSKIALAVSDILFVLIASVVTFAFLLIFTYGEIRLYVIFGEFLGFFVYYFSFGVIAVHYTEKTVKKIKVFFGKIFSFVFAPFVKIFRFFTEKTVTFLKKCKKMSKKSVKNAKYHLQKDKALLYNLTDRMHKYSKKSSEFESDGNHEH